MIVTVLKDVLIARGQLEKYFEGSVPVDLFRALNRKRPGELFSFVEREYRLSNGRPRPADIKIEERNGVPWVCVADRPRGISTFNRAGIPTGNDWSYVKIPKGTPVPSGLAIVDDGYRDAYDANHFTIAPAQDMPLGDFRTLLLQFARAIVARQEAM